MPKGAVRYRTAPLFTPGRSNRRSMIAVMSPNASSEEAEHVVEDLRLHNLKAQISQGEERTVIGVIGTGFPDDLLETLEVLPGVDRVTRITRPYKLASRDFKPANTVVEAGGRPVGGREFVVMAGAGPGGRRGHPPRPPPSGAAPRPPSPARR